MEGRKPFLTFSHPRPGPVAFLFKKAAEKNAELLRHKTLVEHREAMEHLADVRVIAPGMRFHPVECAGVVCEWIDRADSRDDRMVLYLHGGSWMYGSLNTARAVGMMLASVTGCRVLVVDYSLAPEHPFPAACDDCLAVYRWLCDNGFPAGDIGLFGDSAGGNLSLSLIHRLREEHMAFPAAIGLASPATDMTVSSALYHGSPDLLYTQYQGEEHHAFSLYCGEHDPQNPLISPAFGILSDFPPMLIHVGQDEDLCVDCLAFAQKAYDAGADVALKIWRGMYHDFTTVGVTLSESRESLKEFGAFFEKHLK